MISITTILSFAVVLLAASSYSAPIDIQPDSSKINVKNPNEKPVFIEPVFNKEFTSVSNDRKDRSSEEKDSDEKTTEGFTHSPRGFQAGKSEEMPTEVFTRPTRGSDSKESDEMTTEAFTRPTRGSDSKESDEMPTEAFTRPTRGSDSKESDELTTESFTRPTREVEEKESEEVTTEFIKHRSRALESKESDEMTTEVFTRPTRGSDSKESEEMTTEVFTRPSRTMEGKDSNEMFTQSPRSFSEDTFPSTTENSKKRTVEEFLFTTLESSTQFNQRAMRPIESQEDIESSSPFPSDKKKKHIDYEPSSSVQTFGKSTGLLNDEPNDQSNEEVKKKSEFPDTVTVIPDKSSETMIFTKSPSKKSVTVEPVEQEQLSQVQYKPNVEKTKPHN